MKLTETVYVVWTKHQNKPSWDGATYYIKEVALKTAQEMKMLNPENVIKLVTYQVSNVETM